MQKVIQRKIHKDCPFDEEELMAMYDMLYQTNAGNHCLNPPHPSWIAGSQMYGQLITSTEKNTPSNPSNPSNPLSL